MKKILMKAGGLIALLWLVSNAWGANLNINKTTGVHIADSTVTLNVSGMDCKTDSKLVETALYRKKGVKKVTIDGEVITIVYNSEKVKLAELMRVIENTGTCEDPNARVHKVSVKTR